MTQRSSLLVDPDSWLAGVLDAGGTFALWRATSGRWRWRVTVRLTSRRAAARFVQLSSAKLRRVGNSNTYNVAPSDTLALLARVMPRMFCLHERASVVYRYLLTRPGRHGMRGELTAAVGKYREKMVARLRAIEEDDE